ncbi:MAG: anthranilate synthase component I family protein, partial [Planctomycetes bacterium]|nr:anthranilate synthase component I family protein [Planctomycetota bacterium]
GLALLDSAAGEPRRHSLLGFDPLRVEPTAGDHPIEAIQRLVARLEPLGGERLPGPFRGGFIGALAYDAGVSGEAQALPPEPWGEPLLMGGLYTDFILWDHARDAAWLVLGDEPGDGRPPLKQREEEVLAALERGSLSRPLRPAGELRRHVSAAQHRERVEAARELIAAGEIYQANLAHRFTRALEGAPIDQYLALREVNPAPYMGYLTEGDGERPERALLSASPELLVEFDGLRATTRPIKGTAARAEDPAEDARLAAALRESAKDRAELAMIVDLARNDLGRVARAGTVRVDEFPALRSYEGVHHLMADVTAEVRDGVDGFELLRALFPGGSITGAPKLRAMEAIAELEGEGRGFFTGSMGYASLDGAAVWNILIRTMLWRPLPGGAQTEGEVSFRVGGGITWGSDAAAEDAETLVKADRLMRALEGEA